MNSYMKIGAFAVAAVVGLKAASTLVTDVDVSSAEAVLEQKVTREPPVSGKSESVAAVETEPAKDTSPASLGDADARMAPENAPEPLLAEILAGLQAERTDLAERRAAVAEEKAAIALARAAMEQEAAQLTELRDTITALLARADENHDADVKRLVSIYSSMKPKQAAGILNEADLEMTVMVLSKMQERITGPILAEMEEKRARMISKIIHERSRLPGDQRF